MKKSIKLLGILLSSLLLVTAISCSNDSVDDTASNPPPAENNTENKEEEKTIDGTYPIKLVKGLKSKTLNQVDTANRELKTGTISFNIISKCTIKSYDPPEYDGEYFYYQFEIPQALREHFLGKENANLNVDGIILSKNKISKTELNLVVSGKGKTFKIDSTEVDLWGTYGDIKIGALQAGFNGLSLEDKNGKKLYFMEEKDITPYVGKWIYKDTAGTAYEIVVNADKTASYNFGVDKKGNLKVDTTSLLGIKLKNEDNTDFGSLMKGLDGKVHFTAIDTTLPCHKKYFSKEVIGK